MMTVCPKRVQVTILNKAIAQNQLELLEVFAKINDPRIMNFQLTMNHQRSVDQSVFHLAVWSKNQDVLKFIFKHALALKIDLNSNTSHLNGGVTPIHLAFSLFGLQTKSQQGKFKFSLSEFATILEHAKPLKINLEARDIYGRTPLHYLYRAKGRRLVDKFVVAAKKQYDIEFNTDARDVGGKRPRECTPMTGFIPPF